ncbi:MAG TPA: RidA family protein [Candidatus Faecousia faecavium]|nr:RidA family protein [Candidatus Faecousia faecavium]
MAKNVLNTKNAPGAVGPYVQGIQTNNLVVCSGQLGIDPTTGKMPETVAEQAHCSMKNMGAILKEAGCDYSNIIKTTIFLTDMNDFAVVNEIYKSYFDGNYPARSCIQVAKLPLNGLVEIECMAVAE